MFATELGARIASAIVLSIAALLATHQGGWLFALFWLVAGVAIVVEWVAMTRVKPRGPLIAILGAGLAALTGVYLLGLSPAVGVLAAAATAILALGACAGARDRLWVLPCYFCAAVIVVVPPIVRDHPDLDIVGLFWMFAVVWTTDIAAFFTGRALGGPKLWPRVSPKKTWSGFFGGLVAGTGAGIAVASVAAAYGWTPVAPLWLVAAVTAVGSIVSQLGDLAESAMKRAFDVKDSSRLIPGHGGVMDRLDGFWSVALLTGLLLLGAWAMQGASRGF